MQIASGELAGGTCLEIVLPTGIRVRVPRGACRDTLHDLALIEPSLNIMAGLPERYLSRQVRFMLLGDAESLDERMFVKPADCTAKLFDACVYESGRRILCDDDLSRSTPVLVAEPVEWRDEYRAVVLERRIIAFSPYIRCGWLARDGEGRWPLSTGETNAAHRFCEFLLADEKVDLPPAFVLDVGTIADRGWAVVEMNPVWCSGLLGCDLAAVLPALRRACPHRSQLRDDDKRWVVSR